MQLTGLVIVMVSSALWISIVIGKCLRNIDAAWTHSLDVWKQHDSPCGRLVTYCDCSSSPQLGGLRVDCSRRHLARVPDPLPDDVVELLLNDNNITALAADDFEGCGLLQMLSVSCNNLSRLHPSTFASARALRELYLNDNSISYKDLPRDIFTSLRHLNVLHIYNNIGANADENSYLVFTCLIAIEHLSLDAIPDVVFIKEFSFLRHLTSLAVYGEIDVIGNDTFASFANSSVTELKIRTLALYDLEPMAFAHFAALQTLDLSYCSQLGTANVSHAWWGLRYTNISALILTKVEPIHTKYGNAVHLKADFFTFLNLTKVDTLLIDKNNIVDIESQFGKSLPNLIHLDLSYNRLSYIETLVLDLWSLSRLRYLDISHQIRRYNDKKKRSIPEAKNPLINSQVSANQQSHLQTPDVNRGITADTFSNCQTPPLPLCPRLPYFGKSTHTPVLWKIWCFPIAPLLEIVKLTESLDLEEKDLLPILLFGGGHLRLLEYRGNGLQTLRGPLIFSRPPTDAVIDLTDNSMSCLAPDVFKIAHELGHRIRGLLLAGNQLAAQLQADVDGVTFKYWNASELNLSRNGIKTLPVGVFRHAHDLRILNLSENALQLIGFEFSHMQHLTAMDLSGNIITNLDESTLGHFSLLMEKSNSNFTVSFLGNPLQCSCESLHFLHWIDRHRIYLTDAERYSCLYHGDVIEFSNLTDIVLINLDFQCSKPIAIIISSSLLGLAMILVAVSVCCYRYRWEMRYFCLRLIQRTQHYRLLADTQDRYTYDAFVIYSAEDSQWVCDQLVSHLEQEPALRLCVHERDFLPGEIIVNNIWKRLEESRKVIVVISRHLLRSSYCQYEVHLARMIGVEQARNTFVPVMLEDIAMADMWDSLRWIVRHITYLEWPHSVPDRAEFWQNLRESLTEDAECLRNADRFRMT